MDDDLEMRTSSSDPDQNEAGELSHASPAHMIWEEDSGILDLPRKHHPRALPNVLCAICLEAYKPDSYLGVTSKVV